MPAARRGSTRTAIWSRWTSRIARSGIRRRSPKAPRSWNEHCARAGPFQIQAAIAACHATAPAAAQTDWPQIVGLYGKLALVAPSTIVDLNRAVAIGMADGPEAALPLVDAIAATGLLDAYYLLHATRADLLRRAGRGSEASESYRVALGLAP